MAAVTPELGRLNLTTLEFEQLQKILCSRLKKIVNINGKTVEKIKNKHFLSQPKLLWLRNNKVQCSPTSLSERNGGNDTWNMNRDNILHIFRSEEMAMCAVRKRCEVSPDINYEMCQKIFNSGVKLEFCHNRGRDPYIQIIMDVVVLSQLGLNFNYLFNKMIVMCKEMGVETCAKSTAPAGSSYVDVSVAHWVKFGKGKFRKYLEANHEGCFAAYTDYEQWVHHENHLEPSHLSVFFQIQYNVLGIASNNAEMDGFPQLYWRCYDTLKDFDPNYQTGPLDLNIKDNNDIFSKEAGLNSMFASTHPPLSDVADEDPGATVNAFGMKNDCGESSSMKDRMVDLFGDSGSKNSCSEQYTTEESWGQSILSSGLNAGSTLDQTCAGGGNMSFCPKSSDGAIDIRHSTPVRFDYRPKGSELQTFISELVSHIDSETLEEVDGGCGNDAGNMDEPTEGESTFSTHRFPCTEEAYSHMLTLFAAAACVNPVIVTETVCRFIPTLIMAKLFSANAENTVTHTEGRSSVVNVTTVYGSTQSIRAGSDCKYRVRVSDKSCACSQLCSRCTYYDDSRTHNARSSAAHVDSSDNDAWKRKHLIHRCASPNFTFLNGIIDTLKENDIDNGRDVWYVLNADTLAMDSKAIDYKSGCFPSAKLHNLFCPNQLVVHRGQGHRVYYTSNVLNVHKKTNTCKDSELVARQSVNTVEAFRFMSQNCLKSHESLSWKLPKIKEEEGLTGIDAMFKMNYDLTISYMQLFREIASLCELCNSSSRKKNYMKNLVSVCDFVMRVAPTVKELSTILKSCAIDDKIKECEQFYAEIPTKLDAAGNPLSIPVVFLEFMTLESNTQLEKMCTVFIECFMVIARYVLQNYHASVAANINAKTFLSYRQCIQGYRCATKLGVTDSPLTFRETMCTVFSSIVCSDFVSDRGTNTSATYPGMDFLSTGLEQNLSGSKEEDKNDKEESMLQSLLSSRARRKRESRENEKQAKKVKTALASGPNRSLPHGEPTTTQRNQTTTTGEGGEEKVSTKANTIEHNSDYSAENSEDEESAQAGEDSNTDDDTIATADTPAVDGDTQIF